MLPDRSLNNKQMKYLRLNINWQKQHSITTAQLIFLGYFLFLCLLILMKNLNLGNSVFGLLHGIPHIDKLGHFFLYGLLTYLMSFALKHRSIKLMTIRIPMAPVIMLIATFMEECSQITQEFRTFSLLDMLANAVGIVCFGTLAIWFTRRKLSKS